MGSALQFDSLFSQQHFCSKLSKSVYVHQSYSALSQCRFLDRVKYLHAFRVKSHTHIRPFNGPWSKTTRVGRYQKKHSPTHTHPDHWSSFINLLHILCVQFTCLAVLTDNLSPGPLWSSSWPWTLYFILHAFLQPDIIFFSQHMPIPTQPVLL